MAIRGRTILDIGCVTGRNLLLVPRVAGGGRIIGIDYPEGMLRHAQARIHRAGLTDVELYSTTDPSVRRPRRRVP